jgi:hypothetical protein
MSNAILMGMGFAVGIEVIGLVKRGVLWVFAARWAEIVKTDGA